MSYSRKYTDSRIASLKASLKINSAQRLTMAAPYWIFNLGGKLYIGQWKDDPVKRKPYFTGRMQIAGTVDGREVTLQHLEEQPAMISIPEFLSIRKSNK